MIFTNHLGYFQEDDVRGDGVEEGTGVKLNGIEKLRKLQQKEASHLQKDTGT